ncbi:MAG: hypothetical protein Q8M19_10755 [Reyranella sp.]|nr:hypothetical protein [Reyranella sp.]
MVGRSPASVEMRTPAIVSAMVHVFVVAAAVLNLDFFGRTPPIEPEPVMVEFEAIDKKAAAPTVGNPPPQPKDVPIAQETTKAPPPKTADPPPAPPQPKPEVAEAKPPTPTPVEKPKLEPPKPAEETIALKPKAPEPPKAEEKKPEPPKPAPQVKKPDPPKPAPPKTAPRDKVDSLLDDILKNKESTTKVQTPEQQPKPVQQVTRQAPAAPNLAAVVTASEIEGVRSKIRPCWNFPAGVKDQAGLIVTLVVQMNQDGTPVKADLKEPGRYNNDPIYRAAADAAHRAIMNPRCQPWPLVPEKFNNWRTITFNFDPRDY